MTRLVDIYWLAGLLDGEGCFLSGHADQPRIALCMTDEDAVQRAAELLRPRSMSLKNEHRPNRKVQYRIDLAGRKAAGWMMTLYPILSLRRQAKIRDVLVRWRQRGTRNTRPTIAELCERAALTIGKPVDVEAWAHRIASQTAQVLD